jgi:ribosomal protein S18 acetylase RimI-like enzyme
VKSGYYIKIDDTSLAVLDLTDYYNKGLIITRINVPKAHRGKGFGRKLLEECLSDVDLDGITLWLEIAESDGLNYYQLEAWYERYGFKNLGGIYRRKPAKRQQFDSCDSIRP